MPQVPAAQWYVMLGDVETGPMTRVDVGVEAASGSINGETLVWRDGMAEWLPGARVPELAQLFKSPPKSPRAPAKPPPPPPPKKKDKGMGVSEFDTAHFRLADLATEAPEEAGPSSGGASRVMEFDTAHFRLADLGMSDSGPVAPGPRGGDRLAVPKRIIPGGAQAQAHVQQGKPAPPPPLELDLPAPAAKPKSTLKQASTSVEKPSGPAAAVKSVRAAPAPKPAPPPAAAAKPPPPVAEQPFDPNSTAVDFRTLGALLHGQQVAQELFEKEVVPDAAEVDPEEAKKAEELSKWAAEQLKQEAKAAAKKTETPPPPKIDLAELKAKALAKTEPPPGPSVWLYVGIAGGILAAIGVALFLILD